jgi:hypothetical protein
MFTHAERSFFSVTVCPALPAQASMSAAADQGFAVT